MKTGIFYLNNSGHRWISITNGKKEKVNVLFPETGIVKQYTIAHWEAIGNFAVAYTRIRGKTEQLTESLRGIKGEFMINSQANRDLKWGRKNNLAEGTK